VSAFARADAFVRQLGLSAGEEEVRFAHGRHAGADLTARTHDARIGWNPDSFTLHFDCLATIFSFPSFRAGASVWGRTFASILATNRTDRQTVRHSGGFSVGLPNSRRLVTFHDKLVMVGLSREDVSRLAADFTRLQELVTSAFGGRVEGGGGGGTIAFENHIFVIHNRRG